MSDHGMTDEELAGAAYLLGAMVTLKVHGIGDGPMRLGAFNEELAMLRDIAEGRLTNFASPADLLAPHPNATERAKDLAYRGASELMRCEREAAKLVWAAKDRAFGSPP